MKISAISDVHIKKPGDEAHELLMSFFNNPKVQESDYIFLLGDIFDLMCGAHIQYLDLYKDLFKKMEGLMLAGKKIYYFEGNHDVHLEKLFKEVWKENNFNITQKPLVLDIEGKSYYFSHGDEHEVNNLSYHRYIRFVRSAPLRFVADYLMPYFVLNFLGKRASAVSRKKGSKKFDPEIVREKFRNGVMQTTQGKFNFVLGGHSHVQDIFSIPEKDSIYINNGYALKTKSFIYINNHEINFVPLG